MSLSPGSGKPGAAVIAAGSHFRPGENVPVTYSTGRSSPATEVLCVGLVTGNGSFTCWGHLPAADQAGAAGPLTVTATGFISKLKATTPTLS